MQRPCAKCSNRSARRDIIRAVAGMPIDASSDNSGHERERLRCMQLSGEPISVTVWRSGRAFELRGVDLRLTGAS